MIRRLWEDIDLPLICGAGFTVALTGLFFSQFPDDIKRVKKLNRAATDLKTGNVQTADTLKKLALDTIDDALKDLQKKQDFKNVDVVLKGKVTSNKSVESKMKPGTQLLFQVRFVLTSGTSYLPNNNEFGEIQESRQHPVQRNRFASLR